MKQLTNIFSEEEKLVAKNLLNSINFNTNKNELTYFLTKIEQLVLQKLINYNNYNIKLEIFGGYENSERARAKLISNDHYDINFDIVCLKASFNKKFHDIKHKDILGAFHNLGINYNRIGDIILKDNNIYIFVDNLIAEYLIMNFSRIGRAVLNFQLEDNIDLEIEKEYTSSVIVSSSYRLDSVVAKIINKSRNIAKQLIQKELIKINHSVVTNVERNVNIGDLVSIRKYGRYIIKSSEQNKKTLKYRITVDKLV